VQWRALKYLLVSLHLTPTAMATGKACIY
jgi:hypothetical protein